MEHVVLYPNLLAEMARRGETRRTIAKLIKSTPPTVSKKMLGQSAWKMKEIDILCKHYETEYHVLFKRQEG